MNETTRTFPRQASHHHPEQETVFGPYRNNKADFWVYIVLAFAAGFLTHLLWG